MAKEKKVDQIASMRSAEIFRARRNKEKEETKKRLEEAKAQEQELLRSKQAQSIRYNERTIILQHKSGDFSERLRQAKESEDIIVTDWYGRNKKTVTLKAYNCWKKREEKRKQEEQEALEGGFYHKRVRRER